MERQDLSCTYLAHNELKSVKSSFLFLFIIIIIISSGGRQTLPCLTMLCAWPMQVTSHDAVQIILCHVLHTSQHCITQAIWLSQCGPLFWRYAQQNICTDDTAVVMTQDILKFTILLHSIRQHSKLCLTQALQRQQQR